MNNILYIGISKLDDMFKHFCGRSLLIAVLMMMVISPVKALNDGRFVNQNAFIKSSGEKLFWTIDAGGQQSPTLQIISREDAKTVLNNLKITDTSVAVELDHLSALTVTGTFTNAGSASAMRLKSNKEGTASLIHYAENLEVNIERYIPGVRTWTGSNGIDWHLISAPVGDQPIDDFTTDGADNNYDFYGWDEAADTWRNYKSAATWDEFNDGFDFNAGQGYMVAYQQTQTFTFSGPVNVADVVLEDLTMSGTGQPGEYGNGWHLLGNPFASALDISQGGWVKDKMNNQIQLWCADKGGYKAHILGEEQIGEIEDNLIPPHQGFFVRATEGGASFTIPAAARVHGNQNVYKKDDGPIILPQNTLYLIVEGSHNHYYDVAFVRFLDQANTGFDPKYDAHKLFGLPSRPHLYSVTAGVKYSIYSRPPSENAIQVPVHFVKGTDQQYTMHFSGMHNFYPFREIFLDDLVTGTRTNLLLNDHYTFSAAGNFMPARFVLVFDEIDDTTDTTEPVNIDANDDLVEIYSHEKNVYLKIPEQISGQIYVFSTKGQKIYAGSIDHGGLYVIPVNTGPGIYIIGVAGSKHNIFQKVIIE